MRRKPNLYFLIAIIILMVGIIIISAGFRRLEAKLLPLIVAGIVLCLSVVELLRENWGNKGSPVERESIADEASEGLLLRYVHEGAWIVGFFLAICFVGFNVGTILFILSYLKLNGRRWRTAIIMAILVAMTNYGTFTYLLGIELYPGLIFK